MENHTMQKNMFLNVAAVAALTLLGGCGSAEEVKKEVESDELAAAAVQEENVQVAANEAPAEELVPADATAPALTEEVAPADADASVNVEPEAAEKA